MTPLDQFKIFAGKEYQNEDGESHRVKVEPGFTEDEIEDLAQIFPEMRIPDDIMELMKYASGFKFDFFEPFSFNTIGWFGLENIFPAQVQLTGDGLGNFWIIDIKQNGDWGEVFFACHDPAVMVKQADNLTEFLQQLQEYGEKHEHSVFHRIYEEERFNAWEQPDAGLIDLEVARNSNDPALKQFSLILPEGCKIADLRKESNGSGFYWGIRGFDLDNVIRNNDELLWAFVPTEKKSFWSRLFGR
ncbi:SMI1/KNR4 family protein [Pseudoflavitalea sp. G-6-1-2]|uniref:SMI1/KNR4 family protein n=1 Tax=Pseudoflavitalea sp. G-6-1-2 TaxID=2728841 RepID=UPI00146B4EC1|nr:SMI1/KNR4 family protein [Pseudoflavitalea sp. G-6-1-2]NML20453.1 SMI1/KNR4 family protein [Pseudoflavitalea sp. G-6-1-2]